MMIRALQLAQEVGVFRENTAEQLIATVDFYKRLDTFADFCLPDQILLFEESWLEVFIMRLTKHSHHINQFHLLVRYMLGEPTSESMSSVMYREVESLKEIYSKFFQMKVDDVEYGYLSKIAIYKTDFESSGSSETNKDSSQDIITSTSDDSSTDLPHNNSTDTIKTSCTRSEKQLEESQKVKALGCSARDALAQYEERYHGTLYQARYKNLLALLSSLKTVSQFTIEELFFRNSLQGRPLMHALRSLYLNKDESQRT